LKLLLDSNAFIWAYAQPEELSATARRALADPASDHFLSMASIWEMAIKQSNGKLSFPAGFTHAIDDLALVVLPISLAHVIRVQTLPFHHRDSFDRMIIAQAMEEGMTIVTRDRHFPDYGVPILKA